VFSSRQTVLYQPWLAGIQEGSPYGDPSEKGYYDLGTSRYFP